MIVKVAAWLYIINAALTLSTLTFSPFGLGGSSNVAVLMMGGLSAAMGVGLLQSKSWARWLALGSSFLGWTFGGLLLILGAGYLLFAGGLKMLGMLLAGGFGTLIGAFVLFALLIWLVSVVINFKLFFHLCSEEGCEEFDVPHGSAGTVAASVIAWFGIFIVNGMMSGGGSLGALAAQSDSSSHEDDARARELEQAENLRLRREQAESARREQAERIRQAEMARAAEVEAEQIQPESGIVRTEGEVYEPAREPIQTYSRNTATQEEDEVPASHRILKCRDSSGGITFTQGYCPPGTKQVEMPASE